MLKNEHSTLKNELSTLKNELSTLKDEVNTLKARMDHFAGALEPATQYALFETAVHEFVGPVLGLNLTPVQEKIKHAAFLVCRKLLSNLLLPTEKEISFSWQNPSGRTISVATMRSLVLRGLAGLVAFIQSQDSLSLLFWNPEDRANLAHNGKFLNAVFSIPPSKEKRADDQSFSETKKYVKKTRQIFTDEASSADIPQTVEDAVSRVVDALEKKGHEITEAAKENNVKGLEAMFGE